MVAKGKCENLLEGKTSFLTLRARALLTFQIARMQSVLSVRRDQETFTLNEPLQLQPF